MTTVEQAGEQSVKGGIFWRYLIVGLVLSIVGTAIGYGLTLAFLETTAVVLTLNIRIGGLTLIPLVLIIVAFILINRQLEQKYSPRAGLITMIGFNAMFSLFMSIIGEFFGMSSDMQLYLPFVGHAIALVVAAHTASQPKFFD